MTLDISSTCLVLMGIALLGGVLHRLILRKGIGIRFCQFLAIGMGIPAIIMLAFSDRLEKSAVASLIGGIVGFFVSKAGKDENNP